MKNRQVMSRSSAMPMKMKMTILTQEVFRRLHNTKDEVPENTKLNILNRFMENLKVSGYNEKERFTILKGGFKTYENLKEKEAQGEGPFYRPPSYKREERKKNKGKKKLNWFKKESDNLKSVMFVEATPNSELINMLKKTENIHKIDNNNRIKFVEKCGKKNVDALRVSDPF